MFKRYLIVFSVSLGLSCENEKFNQSVVDIQKLFQKSLSISSDSLEKLRVTMEEYNETIINCCGNQKVVGQFLYLEGHEYLMYNTYDVHFYAR